MESNKATKTVTYLLILMFAVVCTLSGDVTAEGGYDDNTASDISMLLNKNVLPNVEHMLRRTMIDILKANPSILRYVPQDDAEQVKNQQFRNKRLAGLENLDFMTGVFSRLPMRTSAAMSDLQELMRTAGRK